MAILFKIDHGFKLKIVGSKLKTFFILKTVCLQIRFLFPKIDFDAPIEFQNSLKALSIFLLDQFANTYVV